MKNRRILFPVLVISILLYLSPAVSAAENQEYKFGSLTEMANNFGTDKAKSHRYTEVYEYFFYPIKSDVRKLFEIGIEAGASLKTFEAYFPNAVIYGIDIDDKSSLNSDKIKTFVADQADRKKLGKFIDTYGQDFDIIIDDGGHSMEQQQVSIGFLFKSVKPGGYYVIEDLHTSLDKKGFYGVEEGGANTTLAMIENFIRNKYIRSKYMTKEEVQYLTANIEYCVLYSRAAVPGIMCIIKKK